MQAIRRTFLIKSIDGDDSAKKFDAAGIARDLVADQTTQSVFVVKDEKEEVAIIAAKILANSGESKIKPQLVMRIFPEDLDGLEIEVEKTDSGTQILLLDEKHYDLRIDLDRMSQAVSRVGKAFEDGESRFRRIAAIQLAKKLREISANRVRYGLSEPKHKHCQRLLADHDK